MLSRLFFITLLSSSFIIIQSTTISSFDELMQFPQTWSSSYLTKMTPEELQTTIHLLYLLYSNAVINDRLRLFPTAITQLSQKIRIGIETYHNPNAELVALKTLADHLSCLMSAQAFYTDMLHIYIEDYNKNEKKIINDALADIQGYAQVLLQIWANNNASSMEEKLEKSSQDLKKHLENLQTIPTIYESLSKRMLPIEINIDKEDEKNTTLITRGIVMNKVVEALQIIDGLTNNLNETRDQASQMIVIGTRIYKEFYSVVYKTIKEIIQEEADNSSFLAQYMTAIPSPDHIFEHILENTKIYNQANENLTRKAANE